jgi:hypothetical protein
MTTCIEHNVCHFCGVVFTFDSVNKPCPRNNATLDVHQYIGFCTSKPDTVRWGTHRHFFAPPADKLANFKTTEANSFSLNLRALLLKLQTICIVKRINLKRQFEEADKGSTGCCKHIEMMYVLMEVCGLTADESEIILTLCD